MRQGGAWKLGLVVGCSLLLTACPKPPDGDPTTTTTVSTSTTTTVAPGVTTVPSTTTTTVAPTTTSTSTTTTTVVATPTGWSREFGATCDHADTPDSHTPTNNCDDQALGVAVDAGGNVALAGFYSGSINFGGQTLNSFAMPWIGTEAEKDAFVARFNAAGQPVWAKALGTGGGTDKGTSVATTSSGDVVVGGTITGYFDFGDGRMIAGGNNDAFIARYAAANGAFVWSQQFGANGSDQTRGVTVDAADNTIAVGQFSDHADVRYTPAVNGDDLVATGGTTDYDAFVVKYSPTGALTWAKNFGGTASDDAYGVATDRRGNVYVVGTFYGSATFGSTTLTSSGPSHDVFVAKLDGATGNPIWATRLGGAQDDDARAVTVDEDSSAATDDGKPVVVGTFQGTATLATGPQVTSNGAKDIFVARLSASGALSTVRTIGGAGTDTTGDVALDATGNAIVTGSFAGTVDFGGDVRTASGATDMFAASYNAASGRQWSRQYTGLGMQTGTGVAVASNGRLVMSGAAERTTTFGYGNLTAIGLADAVMAYLPSPPP
jgi:hypothetical protein